MHGSMAMHSNSALVGYCLLCSVRTKSSNVTTQTKHFYCGLTVYLTTLYTCLASNLVRPVCNLTNIRLSIAVGLMFENTVKGKYLL